jgi:ADP-heptose:LPS heptosyltransferase
MEVKGSKLQKTGKRLELAIRRAFISSLKFRSRFQGISDGRLPDIPQNPTILFLRQDRLGDAIISTPVFVELYKKYPSGKFIILLGENNKGIAQLLPIPCEIVVYRKKPLADFMMLRKLRKRKIDVLIDLMDNPSSTSSILIAAIAPGFAIGIEKDNSSSYQLTVPLIDRAKFHIIRRIAELVRPFGLDPERMSLKPILKDIDIKKVPGRAGIVLSAGAPDRRIPQPLIAEVASGLLEKKLAREVSILYHPKDKALADDIIRITGNKNIVLSLATNSFKEFAETLASCEFVISPDTSALHLCSAYDIPVVALYVPSPPELHYWTPIGVPYEMLIGQPSLDHLKASSILSAVEDLCKKIKPQIHEEVFAE